MLTADWRDRAACVGADPDIWFPYQARDLKARKAFRICADCPVKTPCAELGKSERFGIWGGEFHSTKPWRGQIDSGLRVPVTGAMRRLQALACKGFCAAEIIDLSGVIGRPPESVENIRSGAVKSVPTDLDRAITDVYRLNCGRRSVAKDATAVIGRAVKKGWAPPAAWVGLNIDDPDTVPHTRRAA